VLLASFLAATLVPFSSEAVRFGYLHLYPQHEIVAVMFATLGNTMGGMTTYAIGRWMQRHTKKQVSQKALHLLRTYGSVVTVISWLPPIGDAICLAAGWLRVNWPAALAFMALGRLARYVAIAYIS